MCMEIESFLHTTAHTAPLGTPPLACASCQEMCVLECICGSPCVRVCVCVYLHLSVQKGVPMYVSVHTRLQMPLPWVRVSRV